MAERAQCRRVLKKSGGPDRGRHESSIETRGPYELFFNPDAPLGTRGGEGNQVLSWDERRRVAFTWNAPTASALSGRIEPCRPCGWNPRRPKPQVPEGVDGRSYDGAVDREILDALNRIIDEGPFQVRIDRTFALDQAAAAHRTLDEHYLGKLTIRVGQES